ncbi:MAG: winged helix-turn-helix domain-containing protein [Candidatus Heimdallarchaeota archaeon]
MRSQANANEYRRSFGLSGHFRHPTSAKREVSAKLQVEYKPQRIQRKLVRRSKFEIWVEILEACVRTSRSQSWLLQRVGLKTQTIKESLHFLIVSGLLKQLLISNGDRREFQTTMKGEEALSQYYELVTKYFVSLPLK